MGVLDALNEYVSETSYIKHPYLGEDMSFRYTYALGVTISAYVDDVMEEGERQKLHKLYQSLNMADKEDNLYKDGRNPSRETFELLSTTIETLEQKYIFLLDIVKLLKTGERDGEAFLQGLFKVLKISAAQKEKFQRLKAIILGQDSFKNIESKLIRELENVDFAYKLLVYFFNEEANAFLVELEGELIESRYVEKFKRLESGKKELRQLDEEQKVLEKESCRLSKIIENNLAYLDTGFLRELCIGKKEADEGIKKHDSAKKDLEKATEAIKLGRVKKLALMKEKTQLEEEINTKLNLLLGKKELMEKYLKV